MIRKKQQYRRVRRRFNFSPFNRKQVFVASGIVIAVLALIGIATTAFFAASLSSKERLMNSNKTGVVLLDINGKPFYEFYGASKNTHVALESIAPLAQKAAISSEDQGFYDHPGFSITGIGNAVYENIRPNGLDSGGSTITQQLTRTALLSQDRNFLRKYQELVLSIEIERRYSKEEILEMYLNSIYFGEGVFGIEDASQTYFGKPAKDLSLAESSMLIGIVPAPSAYSPISGDVNKAEKRQEYVLNRMKDDGYIKPEDAIAAAAAPLTYMPKKDETADFKAPHFALMVKDQLIEKYGEEKIARSGYQVKTTLNLDWQIKAETALNQRLSRLPNDTNINGSVVIIDPKTGRIAALVGSRDWNNEKFGKVNMATSPRQPGSSFKPIMYSTGIEEGSLTAATILHDEPTDFGNYKPKNFDLKYRGDVTLRRALANSLNVPAVEALQKVGIADTIENAKNLGITTITESPEHYGLSLTLGTASLKLTELTNAYATFANAGRQYPIQSIESIKNKDGSEIFKDHPAAKSVISSQTSYIMSNMLSDNAARAELIGSGLTVAANRPVAAKTGTTEDYRDALTVGYTPSLAIGIWMGNNDNSPISVGSAVGPAPVWRTLMQQILTGTPVEQFVRPSGVVAQAVCYGGGVAVQAGNNTYTEYFKSGTVPTQKCNVQKDEPEPKKPKRDRDAEEEEEEEDEETNPQPTPNPTPLPNPLPLPTPPVPPGNGNVNGDQTDDSEEP